MAHREVVAIGASAGGVEALRSLVAALPADLPAAVLVVLHVPRESPSALATILNRSGPLPASTAVDGEELRPGRIYVAPSDHHLLMLDDRLRLSRGPAENGHRPAIDPLFRSVAKAFGPLCVAVVLSGSRDDGAAGVTSVIEQGGVVLVQDPEEALCGSMPRASIARAPTARIAPVADLAVLIGELVTSQVTEAPPAIGGELLANPAGYGCPACGGSLFELPERPVPRYLCRVGHAWSPESLLAEQAVATEGALWMALRALEEKTALSRRMAEGQRTSKERFEQMASDAEQAGTLIRDLITRLNDHPL